MSSKSDDEIRKERIAFWLTTDEMKYLIGVITSMNATDRIDEFHLSGELNVMHGEVQLGVIKFEDGYAGFHIARDESS